MRDSFTTVCGLQKEIYVISYTSASFESLLQLLKYIGACRGESTVLKHGFSSWDQQYSCHGGLWLLASPKEMFENSQLALGHACFKDSSSLQLVQISCYSTSQITPSSSKFVLQYHQLLANQLKFAFWRFGSAAFTKRIASTIGTELAPHFCYKF